MALLTCFPCLPIYGHIVVADNQNYGPENWGTCICVSPKDIGKAKAEFIASVIKPKMNCDDYDLDIAEVLQILGEQNKYPSIVLNGLDNIDARHEVQKIWPDIVIDGAIGSDFSCQVSCHPWEHDTACLLCLFQHPTGKRAEEIASEATGLPPSVCTDPDAIVKAEYINIAPEGKRAWLRKYVGKKVCSVTPEAVVQLISSQRQENNFSPSVPFVACFSACMVVTELIRYLSEGRVIPEPRYQLNLLWGPERGSEYPESRHHDCFCVERATVIERVKAERNIA